MAAVPKWGRSSKRRVRLIRWKSWEIVSITALGGFIALLSLMLARWLAAHPFD